MFHDYLKKRLTELRNQAAPQDVIFMAKLAVFEELYALSCKEQKDRLDAARWCGPG